MSYYERFFQVSIAFLYLSLIYDIYKVAVWLLHLTDDTNESSSGHKRPNYLQPRLSKGKFTKRKYVHLIRREGSRAISLHKKTE